MIITMISAAVNEGWAFYYDAQKVEKIIGYFFLLEFVTMTVMTAALMYQTKKLSQNNSLKSAEFAQNTIIILFGTSYLCRFIWSEFLYAGWYINDESFAKWLIHDIVIYLDGLSLLAMLLLHNHNFADRKDRRR